MAVARPFEQDTLEPLGHQVFCGRYTSVTAEDARDTADEDSGWTGRMLNAAEPDETYVFYTPPGDFGGASAVSADTGLTVFGGSIVWDGRGDITYPTQWRDPIDIGSSCASTGTIPYAVGYDLVDGSSMSDEVMVGPLGAATQTAVVDAMWAGGYLFHATVLRYPRTVGTVPIENVEWIVLLNGGWLD